MKPTKRDRLGVPVHLLAVLTLVLNFFSLFLTCNGQVIDLEMDVTPQIQGLSHLYQRLNAMLHWPVLRGRNQPSSSPQFDQFSKNYSPSSGDRRSYEHLTDARSSPSQSHAQYVRPPSGFESGSNSGDMVNYVNEALQSSPVDTMGDSGGQGSDFYSASTWDGGNNSPPSSQGNGNEDFSTSSSGSGFYPSSSGDWDVWNPPRAPRRQPPRPRRPLQQQYSFGGGAKSYSSAKSPTTSNHYSSVGSSKSYRPPSKPAPSSFLTKGYKSGPPPGHGNNRRPHSHKSYSYGRPSSALWEHSFNSHHDFHDIFDHDLFDGGWGWKKPHSGWGWPGSHSHYGWGWSPPKDEGWGWSPPVTEGWGWGPKCDPNAPPFKLDSYDDIPPNATFVDGHNRPALREDLPPSLVPPPPVLFTVSGNSSALPHNYSERYSEKLEIRLNPDGTTSVQKEVNNRPSDVPTPAAELTGSGEHAKKGRQPPTTSSSLSMNTIKITTSLIDSPFISAPINGSMNSNKFFERGLTARATAFREGPPNPLVSQMDVLLTLFNQLEEFQNAQNEEEAQKEEEDEANSGWGWGWQPNGGIGGGPELSEGGGSDSDLSTPQLFIMCQRYSVPEPNSSEAGILDSAFNFGPQANRYSFGGLDVISDGWKEVGLGQGSPLNLTSFDATSIEGIQSGLNSRIRGFVQAMREASSAAYNNVEEMAWSGFEQHQYFIIPDGECQEPIDPPKGRGPTSLSQSAGAFDPNAGGCYRARGCA